MTEEQVRAYEFLKLMLAAEEDAQRLADTLQLAASLWDPDKGPTDDQLAEVLGIRRDLAKIVTKASAE